MNYLQMYLLVNQSLAEFKFLRLRVYCTLNIVIMAFFSKNTTYIKICITYVKGQTTYYVAFLPQK